MGFNPQHGPTLRPCGHMHPVILLTARALDRSAYSALSLTRAHLSQRLIHGGDRRDTNDHQERLRQAAHYPRPAARPGSWRARPLALPGTWGVAWIQGARGQHCSGWSACRLVWRACVRSRSRVRRTQPGAAERENGGALQEVGHVAHVARGGPVPGPRLKVKHSPCPSGDAA